MPDASLVAVNLFCRIDVVSAVLDVLAPTSRSAALPMRSLLLLLQPTNATMTAAVNKVFFISSFLIVR
jgi:hypothetical protein